MKARLDTQALRWFLAGSSKLSLKALALIRDPHAVILVSPAALWEISMKDALGT